MYLRIRAKLGIVLRNVFIFYFILDVCKIRNKLSRIEYSNLEEIRIVYFPEDPKEKLPRKTRKVVSCTCDSFETRFTLSSFSVISLSVANGRISYKQVRIHCELRHLKKNRVWKSQELLSLTELNAKFITISRISLTASRICKVLDLVFSDGWFRVVCTYVTIPRRGDPKPTLNQTSSLVLLAGDSRRQRPRHTGVSWLGNLSRITLIRRFNGCAAHTVIYRRLGDTREFH